MMLSSATRPTTPPQQQTQHCYYWAQSSTPSPSSRGSPTTIMGHHHYSKKHRTTPPPPSLPIRSICEGNSIIGWLAEYPAMMGESVHQNHKNVQTRNPVVSRCHPKRKISHPREGRRGSEDTSNKRQATTDEVHMEEDETHAALVVGRPLIPDKQQEVGSPLSKTFAVIKSQLSSRSKQRDSDFDSANQGLSALRQEIIKAHRSVSPLSSSFCLEVYEFHSRLLLEQSKLEDFDQCLVEMRSLGLQKQQNESACDEFAGYAILSALVRESWLELHQVVLEHQEQEQQRPRPAAAAITSSSSSYRHALAVVRAVQAVDYQTFFRLYETAPPTYHSIMKNHLLDRVRRAAYLRIIYAHRHNNIGMEQVRAWLHLDTLESTRLFLQEQGAVFLGEPNSTSGTMPAFWIDCKASQRRCSLKNKERTNSLYEEDNTTDELPSATATP